MLRKALGAVALLSLAGLACDDSTPMRPRDASVDVRRADAGRDAGAPDRMLDTAPPSADGPVVDAPPDTAPPADRAVDLPRDTPPIDAPPDTTPVDTALPDTALPLPDTAPDTAPPDTAPDTALPLPDTAPDTTPDTQTPDTNPTDAEPPFRMLNGCAMESDFDDETMETNVVIEWANDQDGPICIKIKAGTEVVWTVAGTDTFATHPVEQFPMEAGNPISGKSTADMQPYEESFPTPGTYGFHCSEHPDTMEGAIWVVP
jgi:plastocyanin